MQQWSTTRLHISCPKRPTSFRCYLLSILPWSFQKVSYANIHPWALQLYHFNHFHMCALLHLKWQIGLIHTMLHQKVVIKPWMKSFFEDVAFSTGNPVGRSHLSTIHSRVPALATGVCDMLSLHGCKMMAVASCSSDTVHWSGLLLHTDKHKSLNIIFFLSFGCMQ